VLTPRREPVARTIIFDRAGSAEVTIYCDNDQQTVHDLGELAIRLVREILGVLPDRIAFPPYSFTLLPHLDPSERPVARIEIQGYQLHPGDLNAKLRRVLGTIEFPLASGEIAIRVNDVDVLFCIYDPTR
jgi:hypothetical protein